MRDALIAMVSSFQRRSGFQQRNSGSDSSPDDTQQILNDFLEPVSRFRRDPIGKRWGVPTNLVHLDVVPDRENQFPPLNLPGRKAVKLALGSLLREEVGAQHHHPVRR